MWRASTHFIASPAVQDRYNTFGTPPDVIEDDWIDNIKTLGEKQREFPTRKKQANAFDLRYSADLTADDHHWERCERPLARPDVTKRLSLERGERAEKIGS